MKKALGLALTAAMLVSQAVPCFAAGKLEVTQENFHIFGNYAYAYARVENTGDRPIKIQAGILEVFDAEGENITSADYINSFGSILQPEEYTYVSMYVSLDDSQVAEVDDYMLTVTGKSDLDYTTTRFAVEPDFQKDVQDGYWNYDYMYGKVTNETDETVYNMQVGLALLDDEENILYLDSSSLYNYGIEPGSAVTYRTSLYDTYKEALEKEGLTATHVDAVAYTDSYN
ncbi:MAG: hypothetical protein Q4B09_09410 [Lachnospiraceae bacterium]|nr:hypothetical protein [Lachnospiraceae bacterium]